MYAMNIWSCLWASIGIFATGEIFGLFDFLTRYPHVILRMFYLGLAGAVGQVRIEVRLLSKSKRKNSVFFYRILSFLLLNGLGH